MGRRIFNAAKIFATKKDLIDSFDTNNVTFTVVNSDQVNAFVLPGNHVFCKSKVVLTNDYCNSFQFIFLLIIGTYIWIDLLARAYNIAFS